LKCSIEGRAVQHDLVRQTPIHQGHSINTDKDIGCFSVFTEKQGRSGAIPVLTSNYHAKISAKDL
jgi:hypothetical protein